MNDRGHILLLSESPIGEELSRRLGATLVARDPYEAMETLVRTHCLAVLLTAPRPELPSLCRALRRLGGKAKMLALSSVASEPEVRTLVGKELDDYFIYPPTRTDIADIRRLAGMDAPAASPSAGKENGNAPATAPQKENGDTLPQASPAGVIGSMEINQLLEAATGVSPLESAVAGMAASRLAAKVRWTDASASGKDDPLLVVEGEVSRALVGPPSEAISAQGRQFLDDLRMLLPTLMTAARRTETLHRLAITDHLTGAYNRRYFYHLTDHILRQAKDNQFRVTLLLYDIDNFKHYNETYGHAAGDEILRETASMMKRTSRTHDVVARIGGDEFAVLFWDVQPPRRPSSKPLQGFHRLAERFRRAVSNHSFPILGPEATGALTISGGLANFPTDGQTCRELLRAADHALREVKRSGKNAIQIVGGETNGVIGNP